MTRRGSILLLTAFFTLLTTALFATENSALASIAADAPAAKGGVNLGEVLPIWSVIPFVGILLSIAIFPLVAGRWWHHNFGKVSAFWGLLFAIPFLYAYGDQAVHDILHIYLLDYFPFIILLWALYTVSGGILIKGAPTGTPIANTVVLIIGSAMASWIGTTGAAMVLIRPFIKMNKFRKSKVHLIVFFIFLVANVGGSLTPLGDPPLFLGFLKGVPFFWTMNLLPHMIFVAVLLLVTFYFWDSWMYRREGWHKKMHVLDEDLDVTPGEEGFAIDEHVQMIDESGRATEKKLRIEVHGLMNLPLLLGVIAGVLFSGSVKLGEVTVFGIHMGIQNIIRDAFLILMGIMSLRMTPKSFRDENEFTWFPIEEVGKLFAGIFITIIPALAMLQAGEQGTLGFIIAAVKEPWQYFWVTGGLSSFLDNAPTYLVFLNTACGQFFAGMPITDAVAQLIAEQPLYLEAISSGAVFFGALTYIGNAPNFMVKSIAEQADIKMPSFFGYMLYSVAVLGIIFVGVTFIFFL